MNKKLLLPVFYLLILTSCFKGKRVDLIVHNAKIHTIDENNTEGQAMAIKNGKIIEIGPERQILNKYTAEEEIDAGGKDVYPGFTDAHAHLFSLAEQKLTLDLTGCQSFDELLVRLEKYASKNKGEFIIGRGWDQSLWPTNEMPDNTKINEILPNTPVCLYRIDGHAALVNNALLEKAKINLKTTIEGGQIEVKNQTCTGILLDNAMNLVQKYIPPFNQEEIKNALLEIQEELFQYGITGIHEAGIENEEIKILQSLVKKNQLLINIYAMLYPTEKNFIFAKKEGVYKLKNLSIRSFKVMLDGALGSRGALLKKEYEDQHGYFGIRTTSEAELNRITSVCEITKYQLNTHCIGDSAAAIIFKHIAKLNQVNKDHRSRIEHAQVIDTKDFHYFSELGIFPSVQPTHAVSDQRWTEQRIGKERIKGAYAYKSLLNSYGMLALGTDFPVESTDPFLTIHAAVQRKDINNFPSSGFYPGEALTFEECIKGMTIWPAFASFQEMHSGSLEKGKEATFVIFENPVNSTTNFQNNFAYMTFIKGKKVFSGE